MLSAAAAYRSTTWSVSFGVGVALPYAETVSASVIGATVGCVTTWIGTSPGTVTLSATPAGAPTGSAAMYEFALTSPSLPGAQFFGLVTNGSADLLFSQTCVGSVS